VGFYIPTGPYRQIFMIIPMGDIAEVFNAELRVIYEYLQMCYHHLCQDGLCHCQIHIFMDN
jgi:hypothetical protein